MAYIYRVYHRDNPDQWLDLEFDEPQTSMRVRDRACKQGNYPWKAYIHLKVKRVIDPPNHRSEENE